MQCKFTALVVDLLEDIGQLHVCLRTTTSTFCTNEELSIQVLIDPYKTDTKIFTGQPTVRFDLHCSKSALGSRSAGSLLDPHKGVIMEHVSSKGYDRIILMVDSCRCFALACLAFQS
jgi:hypothetical protein